MLENDSSLRRNQRVSITAALVIAVLSLVMSVAANPVFLAGLPVAAVVYYSMRRNTLRRVRVQDRPLPKHQVATLTENVAFYRVLDEAGKDRFRRMVQVFLDETLITGIRTEADDATCALVAASAVIPVFGFDDWEYSGLGEVLIYPDAFGVNHLGSNRDADAQQNILGMVGTGHLSGVMILSKADLWAGFTNPEDKRNVGIHEFAHLVDKADGVIDGLPPGVDAATAGPWIRWVGDELRERGQKEKRQSRHHIDDYAYTNEAEYFAVLTEYFFEAPDVLQRKAPKIYQMMQTMYRQNTKSFLSRVTRRKKRVGRNSPCPCGSGEKYKRCCLRKARKSA